METKKPAKSTAKAPEVDNEKLWAASAYILFFLPLLTAKESKFAMFHASQGTNLFALSIAIWLLGALIPFLGWFIIAPIGTVVVVVFAIIGIINAANGQSKELPLIGKYKLLDRFYK